MRLCNPWFIRIVRLASEFLFFLHTFDSKMHWFFIISISSLLIIIIVLLISGLFLFDVFESKTYFGSQELMELGTNSLVSAGTSILSGGPKCMLCLK